MNKNFLLASLLLLLAKFSFSQTTVEFNISDLPETSFKFVGIRGNAMPLSWQKSYPLIKVDSRYHAVIEFPENIEVLEFKFVLYNTDEELQWERIENRRLELTPKQQLVSNNEWDEEPSVDVKSLKKLQPSQLLEDYALIEQYILEVHPGTYRYNNSTSINEALLELKTKFQTPLTYGECFLAISKFLAYIECGHTIASIFNQNNFINAIIHKQKNKLPFTFRWIDDKMIVDYDVSTGGQLKRGSEILSINGIKAKDIRDKIAPYISVDGATYKSKIAKLEVEGFDFTYNDFDVFYPLIFDLDEDSISLNTKVYGREQITNLSVELLTLKERKKRLINKYPEFPETKDDLWHFEIIDDNIGILTLNTFGLLGWKAMTLDYKAFLANTFSTIASKKIKHLVIDIRKNIGGNDEMVRELYTYFNLKRIIRDKSEGRTRYLDFPEMLKPYVQSYEDPSQYYKLTPDNIIIPENGYYRFPKSTYQNAVNKRKKHFYKGKVYLLTSPSNVSLAYYLARNVKQDKIGLIIGRETGGNLRGINGGQVLFLRLPNSTIEIDLPIIGEFMILGAPNSGVVPDMEVLPNIEDMAKGVDTEIEFIKKLIKKGKHHGSK